MKFLYSEYIWLFVFLPLVFLLFIFSRLKRKKIINNFLSYQALKKVSLNNLETTRFLSDFFSITAVFFLIISILGPITGYKKTQIPQKGVEIVFALDVSKSMLCEDIKPSRIKRAKLEISNLVKNLKGDRAGLVVFAGDGFVLSPLTLDYRGFDLFLDNVSPYTFPIGGTNIYKALEKSFELFDEKTADSKVVILISDGEENTGKSISSLKKREDIVVFTIGIASEQGGPVPIENLGFLKDDQGKILISKKNDFLLRDVAQRFNGSYFDAESGFDLKNIYEKQIREKMKLKEFDQRENIEDLSSYRFFGGLAFIFATLSLIFRKKFNLKFLFLFFIFILPFEVNSQSLKEKGVKFYNEENYEKAREIWIKDQINNPGDLKLYYNIGNSGYKNKDYDSAQKNYEKVYQSKEADDNLRYNSLFNLGNTHLLKENYDKAMEIYEKYLEKFPDDEDAQKNLMLAQILKNKKKEEQNQKDSKDNKSSEKQESSEDKNQSNKENQKENSSDNKENQSFDQNNETNKESESNNSKENKKDELAESKKESQETEQTNIEKDFQDEFLSSQEEKVEPGENYNYEYDLFNKVKDKPMGLIPYYKKKEVEKDW
ncbi:MAG: VWA domain-containing protein [Desulforegulaceae bacterium]|nr:VWA domain-containing protein [Desulforegulaceae bacterium]